MFYVDTSVSGFAVHAGAMPDAACAGAAALVYAAMAFAAQRKRRG